MRNAIPPHAHAHVGTKPESPENLVGVAWIPQIPIKAPAPTIYNPHTEVQISHSNSDPPWNSIGRPWNHPLAQVTLGRLFCITPRISSSIFGYNTHWNVMRAAHLLRPTRCSWKHATYTSGTVITSPMASSMQLSSTKRFKETMSHCTCD